MVNEENLITTLEHSLRQFQKTEKRLRERLCKVENKTAKLKDEAIFLRNEIQSLENSAEKTAEALHSLMSNYKK